MREASRLALLRSAFSLLLGRLHLAPEIEASRVESLIVHWFIAGCAACASL